MCNICNGTHVAKSMNGFTIEFVPCPDCGPMDPKVKAEKNRLFEERLAAAEMKFEVKSA
ncbi:translation initiation factor 2 beta subunit (eIF-2beta)/eIF-5 [Bacillus pakistanensis]|uniref:Translation initiation factor 2 beta subunit (eIF-2beta)/eIF-5 n=1 Tax=Rossellomorea pakistanensis TaxID=992288 RepID=A0ABS2ND81_9BACI|nr:hypothetical protein [Bacillus pakistanensis]MBM7585817.1 translation initiation factor 2 beta subunit (eIF-2beta)/eIF-5 [Bacillus pakistanensis]